MKVFWGLKKAALYGAVFGVVFNFLQALAKHLMIGIPYLVGGAIFGAFLFFVVAVLRNLIVNKSWKGSQSQIVDPAAIVAHDTTDTTTTL